MKTKRQVPAWSLALVVMAAGVATASPELSVDAIGAPVPIPLSDTPYRLSDPTPGHESTARR
jgi:hypothetical protein